MLKNPSSEGVLFYLRRYASNISEGSITDIRVLLTTPDMHRELGIETLRSLTQELNFNIGRSGAQFVELVRHVPHPARVGVWGRLV